MSVAVDATNVVAYTDVSSATTITQSVTIGASDNLLVVLVCGWGLGDPILTTPLYNSVALTNVAGQYNTGLSASQGQEIWYLKNPTIGTANFTATTAAHNSGISATFVPMSGASGTFGTPVYFTSSTLATGSVTPTGSGSNGLNIGQAMFMYTTLANGGAPMVNLENILIGSTARTSTDYTPGSGVSTLSYTGSGGTNTGGIIAGIGVLASSTGGATQRSYFLGSSYG